MDLTVEMLARAGAFKPYLEEIGDFEYAIMPNILGDQFRTNPDLRKYAFYQSYLSSPQILKRERARRGISEEEVAKMSQRELRELKELSNAAHFEMTHRGIAIEELKEGNINSALLFYRNALEWRLSVTCSHMHRHDSFSEYVNNLSLEPIYGKLEDELMENVPKENFSLNEYYCFLESIIETEKEKDKLCTLLYYGGEEERDLYWTRKREGIYVPNEKRPDAKYSKYGYALIKLYEKMLRFDLALGAAKYIEDENEQERLKKLLEQEPVYTPKFWEMLEIKKRKREELINNIHALSHEAKEKATEGKATDVMGQIDSLLTLFSKLVY